MKLWIDGVLRDIDRARIAPNDRGFLLADGLFETMRALDGEVRFFEVHCQRLRRGMEALGITIEWSDAVLAEACREVLTANELEDASLRLTVTRGTGPRGLLPPEYPVPTVLVTAAGVARHANDLAPVSMTVSGIRRNEGSPLSQLKALNYLDNIMALRQAKASGFDDALMLNNAGNACSATAANFFILSGSRFATPPLSDGVLDGITRARFMRMAADQGFEVVEESLSVTRVIEADAAYLTNSLIGVRNVGALDGRRFDDAPCPVQLD